MEYYERRLALKKSNEKKKVTLFLDTETLSRLEFIAESIQAGSNKSYAVRCLAKEYNDRHKHQQVG